MRLEVLLGVEGGPVDAREHLAVGVAAPVRAGDRQQLERLDALGRRRVRAAAEVGEAVVGVERDGRDALALHQVLDQLDLVVLLLAGEALERLVDRDVLAHERLVGLDVLAHLGLELLEVVLGDGDALGELEVVVEAVGDRRADRDLRARVQLEHRGGQHVRGVVADQLDGVGVVGVGGDDLDPVAVVQRRRRGRGSAPRRRRCRRACPACRRRRCGSPARHAPARGRSRPPGRRRSHRLRAPSRSRRAGSAS